MQQEFTGRGFLHVFYTVSGVYNTIQFLDAHTHTLTRTNMVNPTGKVNICQVHKIWLRCLLCVPSNG